MTRFAEFLLVQCELCLIWTVVCGRRRSSNECGRKQGKKEKYCGEILHNSLINLKIAWFLLYNSAIKLRHWRLLSKNTSVYFSLYPELKSDLQTKEINSFVVVLFRNMTQKIDERYYLYSMWMKEPSGDRALIYLPSTVKTRLKWTYGGSARRSGTKNFRRRRGTNKPSTV